MFLDKNDIKSYIRNNMKWRLKVIVSSHQKVFFMKHHEVLIEEAATGGIL